MKIKGVTVELLKIAFERRGYITFYFEDKKIVSVPLSNFPPIKKLNAKQRKDWEIVNGKFFSFFAIKEAYSIKDIFLYEENRKEPSKIIKPELKPDYQGMSKKDFLEIWFDTCKTLGFTRKEAIFYLHHQGIYVTK